MRIPATVITGFLGAGKTTLIRHLLENAGGRRIALIINEFGDLGVDKGIVEGCGIPECDEGDVVELANGCICCTVADDFLPTMEMLLARDPAPDHILIETSGLALPKPLLKAFAWPEVRARATVDGVIAVVDGPAVAAGRFAHAPHQVDAQRRSDETLDHESPLEELFEEQLGSADMVLINKWDGVAPNEAESVRAQVAKEARPGVRAIEASHGKIAADVLLGIGAGAEDDLESRPSHHDDHHHDDEDGDHHGHDDFATFSLDLPPVDDPGAFLEVLAAAARRHDVLRMKGFLDVPGKSRRHVIQGVGPRFEGYYDRPWQADEARRSSLVVIGLKGLDRAGIEAELSAAFTAAA